MRAAAVPFREPGRSCTAASLAIGCVHERAFMSAETAAASPPATFVGRSTVLIEADGASALKPGDTAPIDGALRERVIR